MVTVMRAGKEAKEMLKGARRMAVPGKHELMLRRARNRNVHVITPHGRIVAGRKGRKG